ARLGDAVNESRQNAWHTGCVRDIASRLSADRRSGCVDDLEKGAGGEWWNKVQVSAGPAGTWGWDLGRNRDQGFEAACDAQTQAAILRSNQQKSDDDN